MNKIFFIKNKNIEKGPLSFNELYEFIDSKNYLIWYKGIEDWTPFEESNIYNKLLKQKEKGAKKSQLYKSLSMVFLVLFITLIILIALPYNNLTRIFFQKEIADIYLKVLVPIIILLISIKLFKWSIFVRNDIFIEKDKTPIKYYIYGVLTILLIFQISYFLINGFYFEKKINNIYSEIQIQNKLEYNSIEGKKGLKNSKENKIIIPPIYNNIIYYDNDINENSLFIVQNQINQKGVININNNLVVPFEKQTINFLNKNNFIISKEVNDYIDRSGIVNHKFGIVNSNNQTVIPDVYSKIYTFPNNFFIVNSGSAYNKIFFVIDIKNKKISRNYIDLYTFKEANYAILFDRRGAINGVDYIQGDLFDFQNRIIYHKIDEDIAEEIIAKKYLKKVKTSNF